MTPPTPSRFPTQNGYLTQKTRRAYLETATERGLLPTAAHRNPELLSLIAPINPNIPIQFWQLYSVLGQDRIVGIVADFYHRVFADEDWFRSVFARVGGVDHHIVTQASMWIDAMGGGPYYHGGDFRLSFHHIHNAHQLMDARGAQKWVRLMVEALDASAPKLADDPRIRLSLNTFLTHFFEKYAADFGFEASETFGPTNPAYGVDPT